MISLENFKKHLDYIKDCYEVLSPDEFFHYVKKGYFPKGSSLLTFDDGLADHYTWVFPELEKRGLKGIFFVPALPFVENRFIGIHKIHCLYGKMGYPRFMEEFKHAVDNADLGKDIFIHPEATNAYPYDTTDIAEFKYAINYLIPPETVSSVTDELFASSFNEKEMLDVFYMNIEQLQYMKAKGMTIGFHGYSHRPLSSLTDFEFIEEMEKCTRFLQERLNVEKLWLSFPYGDKSSVESRNIEILRKYDVQGAFFAEYSCNTTRYHLSRRDCVELEKLLSTR